MNNLKNPLKIALPKALLHYLKKIGMKTFFGFSNYQILSVIVVSINYNRSSSLAVVCSFQWMSTAKIPITTTTTTISNVVV